MTKEGATSRLKAAGVERCYSDPELRKPQVFRDFVARLHSLGLVDYSLDASVESVEMFFVKKKQDRLRLILDCRRSNAWFADPAPVKLTTGESLSKVQIKPGEALYVCNADLANAFYTLSNAYVLEKVFWS